MTAPGGGQGEETILRENSPEKVPLAGDRPVFSEPFALSEPDVNSWATLSEAVVFPLRWQRQCPLNMVSRWRRGAGAKGR